MRHPVVDNSTVIHNIFFSLGSPSPSLNSSVASSPALAATVVEATEDTTDASINDSDPQGG